MTGKNQAEQLQRDFIIMLKATDALNNKAIEQAIRSTPRHLFVDRMHPLSGKRKRLIEVDPKHPTPGQLQRIYSDEALLSHTDPPSSTSQPSLVVHMLDMLAVRPGHRVFEVGAGTGWNAALLAHLAGPDGKVVTMDIQSDVTRRARRHLKRQQITNVRVRTGDAATGCPEEAPYDRLITTVTCPTAFPAWWEQLAPKGVMVLTLNDFPGESQCLLLKLKKRRDHLEGAVVSLPGFMLFTGKHGSAVQWGRAERLIEAFAGKRSTARMRAFWACIPDGRRRWIRRDLAFFAQLQGLRVIPSKDRFVLRANKETDICILGDNHITAYGGRESLDRFNAVQAQWLRLGSPSRQQYRVEIWPHTAPQTAQCDSWKLNFGETAFVFSLKQNP